MWVKNIKTGIEWDITDAALLKRLDKNPNYEPVEEKEELPFTPEPEPPEAEPVKNPAPKKAPAKKAGVRNGSTSVKAKK